MQMMRQHRVQRRCAREGFCFVNLYYSLVMLHMNGKDLGPTHPPPFFQLFPDPPTFRLPLNFCLILFMVRFCQQHLEDPDTLEQKEGCSFHDSTHTHTPDTNQARTGRASSHLGRVKEANAFGDKHCQKDHSPLKAKSTAGACCFSSPTFLSLHKLPLS